MNRSEQSSQRCPSWGAAGTWPAVDWGIPQTGSLGVAVPDAEERTGA